MFPAVKRKFTSALLTSLLTLTLLLTCYLAQQVAHLYQQYQKATRLEGYLGELQGVLQGAARLGQGVQAVGEQYSLVSGVVTDTLGINLSHDTQDKEG